MKKRLLVLVIALCVPGIIWPTPESNLGMIGVSGRQPNTGRMSPVQ